MPLAKERVDEFVLPLLATMDEFEISTPERAAAFIAQIAHESAQLHYTRELGSDAYLEKYDTGPIAARLGNTPDDDNDGQKYRGRGLIQITGQANYRDCSLGMFKDTRLLEHPELLEQPYEAARAAGWFWDKHHLNGLADQGKFRAITKKINGGLNGIQDREAYWERAKKVLGVEA